MKSDRRDNRAFTRMFSSRVKRVWHFYRSLAFLFVATTKVRWTRRCVNDASQVGAYVPPYVGTKTLLVVFCRLYSHNGRAYVYFFRRQCCRQTRRTFLRRHRSTEYPRERNREMHAKILDALGKIFRATVAMSFVYDSFVSFDKYYTSTVHNKDQSFSIRIVQQDVE